MVALRAFISYKSEYRDLAIHVRDELQSWGHGTWFDQDDIGKGEYFRTEIQKGLENSDVVIGLVTEEALKSREVLTEWDYAFSGHSRLLLLRYQDVELPYWLRGIQYIDFLSSEANGFEQLQAALTSSDTSSMSSEVAPEFITRHKTDLQYQAPTKAASSKKSRDEQNRENMLQNVHQAWIEGVLLPNLEAGAFDIGVGLKADSVLRYADYSDYQLPESGRDIGQIFHDMNGELLILGKPGSGKTILLLQLAEHLLAKAQNDPKQPIPVIFNLSSWAVKQESLDKWLVNELYRSYQVPKKVAQQMVEGNQLILLLDGLDEVAENIYFKNEQLADELRRSYQESKKMTGSIIEANQLISLLDSLDVIAEDVRDACVKIINDYRNNNDNIDIVVCSRIADYESLSNKLDLNGAILLQDLSNEQIKDYLQSESFVGIHDLLENEISAREMANTPFLLNTMKATYKGIPYSGTPHNHLKLEVDSKDIRRDHLFDINIQQRLLGQTEYPSDKTLNYLRWLAGQMVKHDKTTFHIEDLQHSWMQYGNLVRGDSGKDIKLVEQVTFSTSTIQTLGLQNGLNCALIGVLIFGLTLGLGLGGSLRLGNMLIFGLIFGLIGVIFSGLDNISEIQSHSQPNGGLVSSLKNGLIFGLIFGLAVGLVVGVVGTLIFGLIFGLSGGLFFALLSGWYAAIQHILLRLALSREGVIPRWRYDTFLDYAASVGILRKVGGGYIFRHRMLLEYFAEQWEKKNK